jgi:tetratricopeptide (TPR) repeat protein
MPVYPPSSQPASIKDQRMTTSSPALPRRRPGWRRPRILGILVTSAMIAAATFAWGALRPAGTLVPAAPLSAKAGPDRAVPAPGDEAAIPAAGSLEQIDHSIAAWTKNLAVNPHDYLSATNLAILYHGRGRLSADLGDQERALKAVQTALAIVPGDAGPRALEATIRYTLHDFSGAFVESNALYRSDPTQLGALTTRFDSELELGRIGDARADLATLARGASGPAIDVRAARLAYVTGNVERALTLARAALAGAAADDETDLGFYDYAVAEYARLSGDVTGAESAYSDALAVRGTDVAALVGLARINAFQGHTEQAIAGLRKAAAIAPQPETMALLGDLLSVSGAPADARAAFATVRFEEQLGQIQSTVFDRFLMRFELDHGGASEAILVQARTSLAARPDTTGHDAVAWALYRLGRYDEASREIARAAADGAADARLLFHAGAIALAGDDAATGRADLERALALGPALDPAERTEALRLVGP